MMRSIKIQEGQTLVDIAMQYCGDALAVFDVAELNGIGITDEPEIGQILFVPDPAIDKIKIVEAFRKLVPASKGDTDVSDLANAGIDFWAIEEDFMVS